MLRLISFLTAGLTLVAACSGGSGGNKSGAGFQLVQFLLAGQDEVARNAQLTFVFSSPVQPGQNLAERLKIQNIDTSGPVPDFSLAVGDPRIGESSLGAMDGQGYLISGARVDFFARLPASVDSSDSGLKANGEYHVFLKAGPDGLRSAGGQRIPAGQEFIFETGDFFEDPFPTDPPRVLGLTAVDISGANPDTELFRLDPRPSALAGMSNERLRTQRRIIDPAGGGLAPPGSGREDYDTPWELRLQVSEPVDPASVTTANIRLTQIEEDALTANNAAGQPGTKVGHKEPLQLEVRQNQVPGGFEIFIVIVPLNTLTDDARYRLEVSGSVLGIDSRNVLLGTNGLTGDGRTGPFQEETASGDGATTTFALSQLTVSPATVKAFVNGVESTNLAVDTTVTPPVVTFPTPPAAGANNIVFTYNGGLAVGEVGGLGYVMEFLVNDVGPIARSKLLEFDPAKDRVQPETQDLNRFNTALYNPASDPGMAVGFLNAFGSGKDGDFSVPSNGTSTLDTGDTLNAPLGKPFTVQDLSPNNDFDSDTLPGGPLTYDTPQPTEFEFSSLTVGNNATLQVTGVNPILIRVKGLVQVTGTIDLAGGDGLDGGAANRNGGAGGAGGFAGGQAKRGIAQSISGLNCTNFSNFRNRSSLAKAGFPFSNPGEGPGRGMPGGEIYTYAAQDQRNNAATGTGGGGASHGASGTAGDDFPNAGGTVGPPGPACSLSSGGGKTTFSVHNSGVIGVRGEPGPTYGDRKVIDVLVGGSGGGAGGAVHVYTTSFGSQRSGGAGGGGGGSIIVFAAESVLVSGKIDVTGGDGGKGNIFNPSQAGTNSWHVVSGAGGGGAGGSIVLVSARGVELTGGTLDASGGAGGLPANAGTNQSCNGCNGGGQGGRGYIFLMDPDGTVEGLNPGVTGVQNGKTIEYDAFATGVLTTSSFDGERFQATNLYTELFSVGAADPQFKPLDPLGVVATAAVDQKMRMFVSSAAVDLTDPLLPDKSSEAGDPADPFNTQEIKVALIDNDGVSVRVLVAGDAALDPAEEARSLQNVNIGGRRQFIRVHVSFEYTDQTGAAIGPFLKLDEIKFPFEINAP